MSRSLSWDELEYNLLPWIRSAVEVMGYDSMTPVQAATIPLFAKNKDVVVDSVTGSGKTVSFVIPMLERIVAEESNGSKLKKGHFDGLIVTPTRELAKQIQSVICSFLDHCPENHFPIKSQLLIGSNTATVRDNVNEFLQNRARIIVGTPGRVLDFLQNTAVKSSSCSMVVFDEADRLLDPSFLKDVEVILNLLPKQRRTGLFSATISSAGNNIFKTGLRNPVKVTVKSTNQAPESLSINYKVVEPETKFQTFISILNNYNFKKCIVYFPTCISVTFFYSFMQFLQKKGIINDEIDIFSLYGKLQTSSRVKTLESFSESLSTSVLMTTDVAARGLDIPGVDLVLQLDPPNDPDVFLHRCGRTGRANRIGQAITFLNKGREEDYVSFMAVKGVELNEADLKLQIASDNFYSIFTKWILEDRDRFDLAVKSYVGFIRYYTKHSASSIFRLQTLDYIGLAKMYGLLRLPKMPEITKNLKVDMNKNVLFDNGWLVDPPIDMNKIKYADKKKEKLRIEAMNSLKEIEDKKKLKFELKKKNLAWSKKVETKESKSERRTKMERKRKAIEEQLAAEPSDNSDDDIQEDWKEVIMANKKRKNGNSALQGSFDDL